MKYDIIRRVLSCQFRRLGCFVARKPLFGIAACIALSVIFGSGIPRASKFIDLEYLYSPTNGRAERERDAVESLFPVNLSYNYDFFRITRFGKIGTIHATDKRGELMLREDTLEELFSLDQIINNLTIYYGNRSLKYRDLCCKTTEGTCFSNLPLSMKGTVKEIKDKITRLVYPVEFVGHIPVLTALHFGGVVLDENKHIIDFKAVRLIYPLDYSTEEKNNMASLWENQFLNVVSKCRFNNINVETFVGSSFDTETSQLTEMVFPLMLIATPVITIFASLSCVTFDAVTSKPWLGLASCVSAVLSTVTAFGLLIYCNALYVDLNISVAFLILGIGIDDSFVLLAAWRRTDPKDTVENRMGETFSEAAVSVTITSLTNFVSFCLGMTSPYCAVRTFSLYSSLALLFSYIYQLLFFGGCMAIDGYREEKQLNGFIFTPARNKKITATPISVRRRSKNCFKEGNLLCYKTGSSKTGFWSDTLGEILGYKCIKTIVIIVFIVYFAGGIYSLRWLKEGLDYLSIIPPSSFVYNYTITHQKYFIDYPHRIHVVVNTTLDYSDPKVQEDINDLLVKFQSLPNMAEMNVVESWLSEYLLFINNPWSQLPLRGYNLSNSQDFLEALRDIFLKFGTAQKYNQDILFNDNGTQIITSRFMIQSKGVRNGNDEKMLLENLRNVADQSKYRVYIHNIWFVIYDQYMGVVKTAAQTISIASVLVIVVFLLFIPNISCAACVGLTIISVQISVIGYMSLWNVNLDSISSIILVMCTGFSVDYAAHISYSYICCNNETPNDKIKISLRAAGYPIIQGCASTILAVSVMYFGSLYVFIIFFKIIFLVMMSAAFFGMLLLPVLLSINDTILSNCCYRKNLKHRSVNGDEDSNVRTKLKEDN